MTIKTFAPNGQSTATLAATATSGNVALDQFSSAVRVHNKGPNEAFIQFGASDVAASVSHMPIPAGTTAVFTKGIATHVAGICAATETATLRFTSGEGV